MRIGKIVRLGAVKGGIGVQTVVSPTADKTCAQFRFRRVEKDCKIPERGQFPPGSFVKHQIVSFDDHGPGIGRNKARTCNGKVTGAVENRNDHFTTGLKTVDQRDEARRVEGLGRAFVLQQTFFGEDTVVEMKPVHWNYDNAVVRRAELTAKRLGECGLAGAGWPS